MLLPIRAALLSRNLAMSLVEVEAVYRIVCQKLNCLVSVQSVSVAERWNGLCGYVDNSVDSPTVVYNKDLNFCWRRFTIVKELMHLWSGTADNLRRPDLGASLALNIIEEARDSRRRSLMCDVNCSAETAALVMAIEVLLPWRLRDQFSTMVDMGVSPFAIAKSFMVPLCFVKMMMPNGGGAEATWYGEVSRQVNMTLDKEGL